MKHRTGNPGFLMKCGILAAAFWVLSPGWSLCEDTAVKGLAIEASRKPEYAEVKATGTIEGSAAQIWAVLTDYEHLAQYMPNVKKCRIKGRSGNRVILYYEIGFLFFTTSYTAELNEVTKNRCQTWRLLEGAFRKNSGSWQLEPIGKRLTRLTYHVEISHKLFPDAFILRILKSRLPDVYRAIQERVDENRP